MPGGPLSGLKRAKKENAKDEDEEDLDSIVITEPDIQTEDKMYAQYVKVNRTKQRYR